MRSPASRLTTTVFCACLFLSLTAAGVGVAGIVGVHSATAVGHAIANDELSTATTTARLGRAIDSAYATGQALAFSAPGADRAQVAATLYDDKIPAVESGLVALTRSHADDGSAELAGIDQLATQWQTMRRLLDADLLNPALVTEPAFSNRLDAAYQPISGHVQTLIDREDLDAHDDQARAAASANRVSWWIVGAVAAVMLISVALGWWGSRRLRRAVEPARDQVEFADNLQLAEHEAEAHTLLQGHLQRSISGGRVTVLNRNNSADRLEAMTVLPEGSCLASTLQHAEPRSCLAVRSARVHDEDEDRVPLLACPVCGPCPGRSTCTPLTVGGEVIGSVLVNRDGAYSAAETQRIRDSVAQAAPVLANLRNLAIAELRASTDSLTGLPNKRAVGDTLKRMLAQSSRNLEPLSLLLLDLDHFKDINDRFGHPVGDQALANVGAAIRSALRESDFAGRNGGEEFAVLLPDTDPEGAAITAAKIRAAIADITMPSLDLTLTASVGIAGYPDHATNSERLERLADAALYVAKRSGRNRIEIAVPPVEAHRATNGSGSNGKGSQRTASQGAGSQGAGPQDSSARDGAGTPSAR
jgi:diguanylate cyclase (GGDEF)-like protein